MTNGEKALHKEVKECSRDEEERADARLRAYLRGAATGANDRRRFALSPAAWTKFQALLDAEATPSPKLADLLSTPTVFDADTRGGQ